VIIMMGMLVRLVMMMRFRDVSMMLMMLVVVFLMRMLMIVVRMGTLVSRVCLRHARERPLREVILTRADFAGCHRAEDSSTACDHAFGVGCSTLGAGSGRVRLREGAPFLKHMPAVGALKFIGWHTAPLRQIFGL
jgi:hypothetical protein